MGRGTEPHTTMGLLVFGLVLVVGLLLAYGGYPLYTVTMFVIGSVVAAGGYYILVSGADTVSADLFGLLGVGFVGGLVFLFVQMFAILAVGFILGALAVTAVGAPDTVVQTLGGLVGAGLALVLYTLIVIGATAGLGALIVSKAIVAGPEANLGAIVAASESTSVFWVVFLTGGLVQLGVWLDESEDATREEERTAL